MLAAEATSFLEFQVSSVLIPKMNDINLSPKLVVHSRPIPGNGTGMKNYIPNYWEREREWGISFPTFGNGNGNEKTIPNFREREWEASIPGNGREREFPLTPGPLRSSSYQRIDGVTFSSGELFKEARFQRILSLFIQNTA